VREFWANVEAGRTTILTACRVVRSKGAVGRRGLPGGRARGRGLRRSGLGRVLAVCRALSPRAPCPAGPRLLGAEAWRWHGPAGCCRLPAFAPGLASGGRPRRRSHPGQGSDLAPSTAYPRLAGGGTGAGGGGLRRSTGPASEQRKLELGTFNARESNVLMPPGRWRSSARLETELSA
jgi:hypothetical protein